MTGKRLFIARAHTRAEKRATEQKINLFPFALMRIDTTSVEQENREQTRSLLLQTINKQFLYN